MFIIAEGPEGIYLIDQHAAHERILYERLITAWAQGQVAMQPLLKPEPVTLPITEAAYLEGLLPALHVLGMEVEAFGPGTFLVRSLPALLAHLSPGDLLTDIATSDEESPIHAALEEIIVRRICKRAAVKAGQVLSREFILERVWGWNFIGDSRTVDVHIRWLREKIEQDPGAPNRIVTVRGAGYRFEG